MRIRQQLRTAEIQLTWEAILYMSKTRFFSTSANKSGCNCIRKLGRPRYDQAVLTIPWHQDTFWKLIIFRDIFLSDLATIEVIWNIHTCCIQWQSLEKEEGGGEVLSSCTSICAESPEQSQGGGLVWWKEGSSIWSAIHKQEAEVLQIMPGKPQKMRGGAMFA